MIKRNLVFFFLFTFSVTCRILGLVFFLFLLKICFWIPSPYQVLIRSFSRVFFIVLESSKRSRNVILVYFDSFPSHGRHLIDVVRLKEVVSELAQGNPYLHIMRRVIYVIE